jgi:hypothetical protein
MASLTAHCVVRNEPFVYYAVKSVYDYVDTILLYDTGSDDRHTLEDIQQLLREDFDKKIIFKQVPIEVDETKWQVGACLAMAQTNKGKKGVWWVRQMMIDDTTTPFFLILDGDEVHYRKTMKAIHEAIAVWNPNTVCGVLPLTWFLNMYQVFKTSVSGRVFLTKDVTVTPYSPGEIHVYKTTGRKIDISSECTFRIPNVRAFAHFEKMLKPWRRTVRTQDVRPFLSDLPEVILQHSFYVERFLSEAS